VGLGLRLLRRPVRVALAGPWGRGVIPILHINSLNYRWFDKRTTNGKRLAHSPFALTTCTQFTRCGSRWNDLWFVQHYRANLDGNSTKGQQIAYAEKQLGTRRITGEAARGTSLSEGDKQRGGFMRNSFVFPRIRCYASHLTKKFKEAMAVMNFWGY
jgi:hypothetical protein